MNQEENLSIQISFITELEKLKLIERQNSVLGNNRSENSAEHSWHVALMAIILSEHSIHPDIDLLKVVKMLLIHDIVEIEAGDTFLYDESERKNTQKKESLAAKKIFDLLPRPQKNEFINLWEEFENKSSKEALFAAAMDGLQPLINHFLTAKENDNPHQMTKEMVVRKKIFIKDVSPAIWKVAKTFIENSVKRGLYL